MRFQFYSPQISKKEKKPYSNALDELLPSGLSPPRGYMGNLGTPRSDGPSNPGEVLTLRNETPSSSISLIPNALLAGTIAALESVLGSFS
jgi:hypothetical protein